MKEYNLTDSEKVTMKSVWDLGDGARLAQILNIACEKYGKKWKPQTVSTFLGKLVRKGFVEQYREGRYFYYHILVDKHEYRCRIMREDMEFWNDGDMDQFIDELLDDRTFSPEQRKQLTDRLS